MKPHVFFKNKKTILFILIFLLIGFFLIYFKSKPQIKNEPNKGIFVKTTILKGGKYQPQIPIIATAKAQQDTTITAFISGKVETILFRVGQHVKKGDLLLTFDDKIYKSELEKTKAIIARIQVEKDINIKQCEVLKNQLAQRKKIHQLSEHDYKRNLKLHQQKFVSKSDLDASDQKRSDNKHTLQQREFDLKNCYLKNQTIDAQLSEANSSLDQAEKNYKETKVYAPYDGVITMKNVSAGHTVTTGQTLLSMHSPQSIELEALIPESAYKKVQGRHYGLQACSYQNNQKRCYKLLRLGQNIASSGVGHLAYFQPDASEVIANQKTLRLFLSLPAEQSFLIPAAALYQNKAIYLIQNNQLKKEPATKLGYHFSPTGTQHIVIAYQSTLKGQRILASYLPDARTGFFVRYKEQNTSEK